MSPDNHDGETETEAIVNDAGSGDSTAHVNLAGRANLPAEERYHTELDPAIDPRQKRMAIALAALGVVAAIGGVIFSGQRGLLFAFAATGLFGGLLAYRFVDGRFLSATVSEHIYAAAAANETAIANERGGRGDHVYVPDENSESAKLVVPRRSAVDRSENPVVDRSEDPIAERPTEGDFVELVLEPLGAGLFEEFTDVLIADLASTPGPLTTQLTDGLVDHFELCRVANTEIAPRDGRVTLTITDSALGPVDRFDHPIASFLAVGFAVGLDRPVALTVAGGDDRNEWVVTCRWATSE